MLTVNINLFLPPSPTLSLTLVGSGWPRLLQWHTAYQYIALLCDDMTHFDGSRYIHTPVVGIITTVLPFTTRLFFLKNVNSIVKY